MHDEILTRAHWLLCELHLSPTEANARLLDYFPDLEREERGRYLREAAAMPAEGAGRTRSDLAPATADFRRC